MISMDSAMNNDFLMISKSLVPYLDADKQRSVAIFIKAFELMSTIDLFSKEDFRTSISKKRDLGWEKNLLSDIRTNLSDDRAFFIDAILKLSEVKDLLGVKSTEPFNENATNTSFSNIGIPANSPSTSASQNASPHGSSNTNAGNNTDKATDIINQLSGMLDPNQLQILKVLSSFMK